MNNRQLSIFVAQKIFGWKVCKGSAYIGKINEMYAMSAGMDPDYDYEDILDSPDLGVGKTLTPRRVPGYAEHIATAWELVDRIKDLKADPLSLGTYDPSFFVEWMQEEKVWIAGWRFLEERDTDIIIHDAKADTAERAICLSALKATGIEVPE